MNTTFIGAAAGGAFGLVNFFILQAAAKKIEQETGTTGKSKAAKYLRLAAWADLIIFPLIGAYVGPMILGP